MRNFNQEERKLLEYIVSKHKETSNSDGIIQPIYVYDVFAQQVLGIEGFIQIDLDNYYVEVRLSQLQYQQVFKVQYKIENYFALVISLLDYLEKNNLIKLIPIDGSLRGKITINKNFDLVTSLNRIQLFKGSYSKYNYIYEDINDAIFPTPELVEFVKKDFKDEEQLRHEENVQLQKDSLELAKSLGKKSITIANRSLYIALLSFFASIIPLMRECSRINGGSNTNNNQSTKQQVNSSNPDTSIDNRKQIIAKILTDTRLLKANQPPTDKTRKQIPFDSLTKVLSTDTLNK